MTHVATSSPTAPPAEPVLGVNEMRLTPRQWLVTVAIVLSAVLLVPHLWKRTEGFPTGVDYRLPYSLSYDYWLYQRRLEQAADPRVIPILGDSVVWGEYVRPDGTLSHFLNLQGSPDQFVNCGVNGLFPLALEGLIGSFGDTLRNRNILVQCNPLWLASPKADLSTEKEIRFNHARLVPQFTVKIPCYRADASTRISAILDRNIGYFGWVNHLQNAYWEQKNLAAWTLAEDDNEPPAYPNAWRAPWSPFRAGIPSEPAIDPQRGPGSSRHHSWKTGGAEPTEFEWVPLDRSLQWQAFQRTIRLLTSRGNNVLVLLGPFNEHMVARTQRPLYEAMRNQMADWFVASGTPVVMPETLPSELYADASHPLTAGYALLARQIRDNRTFQRWLASY